MARCLKFAFCVQILPKNPTIPAFASGISLSSASEERAIFQEQTRPIQPKSLSKHDPLTLIINPPKMNLSNKLAQENRKVKRFSSPQDCYLSVVTWSLCLGASTTSTLRTRAKQRPWKKKKKKKKKHLHTNTSKLLFLLCVLGGFSLILLDPIGGSWIPSEQILSRHRIAGHIDGSGSCYEVACHSHADKIINAARLNRRYQQNWYCSCQWRQPSYTSQHFGNPQIARDLTRLTAQS